MYTLIEAWSGACENLSPALILAIYSRLQLSECIVEGEKVVSAQVNVYLSPGLGSNSQ